MLAGAFRVKITVGSSVSFADLWVLSFIRDILVKGWKAVVSSELQHVEGYWCCPPNNGFVHQTNNRSLKCWAPTAFHSVESKLVCRYSKGVREGWPLLVPWLMTKEWEQGRPCPPVRGICWKAQIWFCSATRRPWSLCWARKVLLPGWAAGCGGQPQSLRTSASRGGPVCCQSLLFKWHIV